MNGSRAGNRQARAVETEAALKAAARRVLARQGYFNTKITDITQEAGRAAGSFYNHFASKEDLIEALVADMYAEGSATATEIGAQHDLSDWHQLRAHIAGAWYAFRLHLPEMSALYQASLVNEELARRMRAMRTAKVDILRDHLEYLRELGYTLPGDPIIVASTMAGVIEQACMDWLVNGDETIGRSISDDEALDTLTRFIMSGIIWRGEGGGSPTRGEPQTE